MPSLDARLARLEAQLQPTPVAWSADVAAARARHMARIRLHIGARLDIPHHPAVVSARER